MHKPSSAELNTLKQSKSVDKKLSGNVSDSDNVHEVYPSKSGKCDPTKSSQSCTTTVDYNTVVQNPDGEQLVTVMDSAPANETDMVSIRSVASISSGTLQRERKKSTVTFDDNNPYSERYGCKSPEKLVCIIKYKL